MHLNLHALIFLFIPFASIATESPIEQTWKRLILKQDSQGLYELLPKIGNADLQSNRGKTALMLASKQGDNTLVRQLFQRGAKPDVLNDRGGTAVMYAAANNRLETVMLLMKHRANINIRSENGWTALTLSAAKGNHKILAVLLKAGADPNIPDVYGWTPLMRAIEHDRTDSAITLARYSGSQVNRINNKGETALHIASALEQCEIVKILIDHGADEKLQDFRQQLPAIHHCTELQ